MDITFFASAAGFRRWLESHHASATELWVGYYKVATGRESLTWPESVDEALCFGWIDGIRKSIDQESYTIRFTPRRRRSVWSAVNIGRVEGLLRQGRMQPAGLAAFDARRENRSGIYTYEQRTAELPEPYAEILKSDGPAWEFFAAQSPSRRKALSWWVVSAKTEATRLRRLRKLMDDAPKLE